MPDPPKIPPEVPPEVPPSIVIGGTPRVLACLPPRADFGGLMAFSAANALIPRNRWQEIDLADLAGEVWDQGPHGSCVGHGGAKAFEIAFRMAGGTVPDSGFSPTSLYALINQGRDRGAIVSDAMDALLETGICTMAECPESVIYERDIPDSANATRARFRVSDAFHCGTFDEIGSALQLGFPVAFGIPIGDGFNNPGPDGVIYTGGMPLGGHCMCAKGTIRMSDGSWGLKVRNSWGRRWAHEGDCILVEAHFRGTCDAFAVRASRTDPLDPHPAPPAP
jgi:hypothetical protein